MIINIIFFLILAANPVFAKSATPMSRIDRGIYGLILDKGGKVSISEYNENLELYTLIDLDDRAVGPNFTTPQALAKSAGFEDFGRKMIERPKSYLGSELTLQKELLLMNKEELEDNRKHHSKH